MTPEQLSHLKVLAEIAGKSIGEYMLEKVLPDEMESSEPRDLESVLASRVAEAEADRFSDQSVRDIALELYKEMGA